MATYGEGLLLLDNRENCSAELYRCPVRKRYAWQLVRYGGATRRFARALAGAAPPLAELQATLRAAEHDTVYYPGAFAAAGVQAADLTRVGELAYFPLLSRATVQARYYALFSKRVRRDDVDEGWLGVTSGSTGEPVRFFMDAASIHFFVGFIGPLAHTSTSSPLSTARGLSTNIGRTRVSPYCFVNSL